MNIVDTIEIGHERVKTSSGNQFFITKDKAEDNSWVVGGLNQNTQSQNPVVFTAYAQCTKLGL